MKAEIALLAENPEAHEALSKRLEAAGFEVLFWQKLEDALHLLDHNPICPAVIAYDWRSMSAPGLSPVKEIAQYFPELPQLLFCPELPNGDLQEGGTARFKKLGNVRIFEIPLTDPSAFDLIEEAIVPSPIPPLPEFDRALPGPGGADDSRRSQKDSPFHGEAFLRRVGASNVPVLLHGETGVGKEVMARRLWGYSSRAGKPFLKLNCAALPSELIESELFGYEKGAFTGATMDKPGKFELAQNGTILLDEIGDMDIRLQAKLLTVLQDGEVQPLGSSRIISVNVRVMAATHRDLRKAIEQGNFREDLYYRLSVINITIPPLRERGNEILSLAEQLLLRHLPEGEKPPVITEPLRRALLAYRWPGNVRELENIMRRFLIYQDAELLALELEDTPRSVVTGTGDTLPLSIRDQGSPTDSNVDYLAKAAREAESKILLETLEAVRWNRRQAAARLNVDYKAFLYKLQKHGIVESKAKRKDASA